MRTDDEDDRAYKVVVNDEEQYSIWLADRANAPGWKDAGKAGSKADCLAFIRDTWTDMRPKSLRAKMEELAKNPPPPAPAASPSRYPPTDMNPLVGRLQEPQEVEAAIEPRADAKLLRDAIERGFVFMTFVRTGTRLGVRLDRGACDLARADFDAGTGSITLVGDLTLNYNEARYRGDIDLATLRGVGRLEFVRAVAPPTEG